MADNPLEATARVRHYYASWEARILYTLLLRGVKHFGYYPEGQEKISMAAAQRAMSDKVGALLDLPPGACVLDAGCGEGPVALRLAETRGYHVTGVDLLDWNIARANRVARRRSLQGCTRFLVMDYSRLAFPDDTFDAVYTVETLVHAPDYRATLQEFYRVLRPGGKLVLLEYSVAPEANLTPKQKEIAVRIARLSTMHSLLHFRHDSLPKILTMAGFRDVTVEDITPRVMPMFARFYRWMRIPYFAANIPGLEQRLATVVSVVEAYQHVLAADAGRYNIVTARKP